jgi:hypothetical protein
MFFFRYRSQDNDNILRTRCNLEIFLVATLVAAIAVGCKVAAAAVTAAETLCAVISVVGGAV